MLARLALPAALAAVLAVTGCAAGDPGSDEPRAVGYAETTDAPAGATEQGMSEGADESTATDPGSPGSDAAAESNALRDATASRLNPGEPGVPQHSGASLDDVLRLGAVATWVEPPEAFAVSMPASSDCWASAGEPVADGEGRLIVAFVQDEACEASDAARTYTLHVPDGVDTGSGLELALVGPQDEVTLTLPAP